VLNNQKVIGLRESSFLSVENNDIILKGPKQAVVFKKDENIFEINSGFNLKNLI
jgi:dipeptidase E